MNAEKPGAKFCTEAKQHFVVGIRLLKPSSSHRSVERIFFETLA